MSLWKDLRYGFRQLRRNPGFTATVLATLGLCIGANTAIYSVVDAVLLRPLPYPEPERLVLLATAWKNNGKEGLNTAQTGTIFETVRRNVPVLDVAAWAGTNGVNFAGQGFIDYVTQDRVSTGYFGVLGVRPQMGREFTPAEDTAGGPAVAVLSHAFWQRAFQQDPTVLGRAINLRGEPYTVVGIMPRSFRVEVPVDVWTPLRPSRSGEGAGSNYRVVARLRPGVSWPEANAQLLALSGSLNQDANSSRHSNTGAIPDTRVEERMLPFRSGLAADTESQLILTLGAVLMVLLIGCVNIAGLLLARSAARRREIATRMAIGGSRLAVIRQLLTESVLLALGGGVLGIALGQFGVDGLKSLGAQNLELWHPIVLNTRVLIAMLGTALFTSLLFGLAPALEASRLDIRSVLLEGGRGTAGGGPRRLRSALVIGEIALSLILMVSAGLLVRSLASLNGLNPGFDAHDVLTAQTSLQDARYRTRTAVTGLFTQGLDRISRIPGVQSAGVALSLPFERPLNDSVATLDGENNQAQITEVVYVTPGYMETMRIPLLDGRVLHDSDTAQTRNVALVSASFAKQRFPGVNAVGRHLSYLSQNNLSRNNPPRNNPREVVGVVADIQQHSGMGNYGPLSITPTVYIPVAQTNDQYLEAVHVWFAPRWVVRARGNTGALAGLIQQAIASVDPGLPVAHFVTIEGLQLQATGPQRYRAVLSSLLAGLALLLAAIGLYGSISYSVAQSTREIGIRLALGASTRGAILNVMTPGIALAASGVAIGLVLSFIAARFLQHLLFGVQPLDAATFILAALLLLSVAAVSTLLPALRLVHLDPAQSLRDE